MRGVVHPTEFDAVRRHAALSLSGAETGVRRSSAYAGAFGDGAHWNNETPNARIELILELDGRWELELDGRRSTRRAFVSGPLAGRVRTRTPDAVRLVQLSLDPLTAPAVLGMPAGALGGEAIELTDALGPVAEALLDRLDTAWNQPGGASAAVLAGREWAKSRMTKADLAAAAPPDVRFALALLESSGGRLTIDELARATGCSRRHLSRRFGEWVGATPTELRRLIRLERAVGGIRADGRVRFGEVAVASGYADHAHMVREFQTLIGETPTAFAARS